MDNRFIPSELLSEQDNSALRDQICNLEDQLKASEKTQMRGYVTGIHETRDGKKELLNLDHNHIVFGGRKWLMQRAIGGSMTSEILDDPTVPQPHEWIINWFGVGQGGANSSDPFLPLYTPDLQDKLIDPIILYHQYSTEFKYSPDKMKKTLKRFNGCNAQMKYDTINSEIVALFHLVVDYEDCPYSLPYLGVKISELALYAAPTADASETHFTMFSRYCLPTKYKSVNDKYTFLWYIYF